MYGVLLGAPQAIGARPGITGYLTPSWSGADACSSFSLKASTVFFADSSGIGPFGENLLHALSGLSRRGMRVASLSTTIFAVFTEP